MRKFAIIFFKVVSHGHFEIENSYLQYIGVNWNGETNLK